MRGQLQAMAAAQAPPPPQGGKGAGKGIGGMAPGMGIDTRVLGRPETFQGEDKNWYDWSQVFRAYAGLVQSGVRELLAKAEDGTQKVDNVSLTPEEESCSVTLHYLLVMLCRKEAGVIVCNAGPSEGAVAWRKLVARFEPKTWTRLATLLQALIRFSFAGSIQE